jgi:hypothetical protein
MLLRISRSDHVIAETRWTGAACTIGSDPDCTLCLPDPSLPERIALITSSGDMLQLSGPLSTIDLYCNGQLVTEPVELAVHDMVLIGDFTWKSPHWRRPKIITLKGPRPNPNPNLRRLFRDRDPRSNG